MAMRVRIKLNRKGVHQVLVSAETQEMLQAKAEAIAEAVRAAGIAVEGEPGDVPLPVTTNVTGRGIRARGYVNLDHPSGVAVESKHGILTSSIDAARGA